jgi:hypothetical protein
MIFMTVVSVGVLLVRMVPHRWQKKTPGVSCHIRQRLALGLRVRVRRCCSHRLVPIQLFQFQASSLFLFLHLFVVSFPSLHHHHTYLFLFISVLSGVEVKRPSVPWVGIVWQILGVLGLDRYSPSFSLDV